MYCNNCKQKIVREAKFCPKCGCETISNETIDDNNHKKKNKTIKIVGVTCVLLVGIASIGLGLKYNSNLNIGEENITKETIVEKNNINQLYPVYSNNKWGIMNKDGDIVVEPQFDNIKYGEGLNFIVEQNGQDILIDKDGNSLIEPFDDIYVCSGDSDTDGSEVLYKIEKNAQYGLVNYKGEIVIEPQFDYIDVDFLETELIYIEKNGKSGFANKEGEMIAEPQFDDVLGFDSEGLAIVRIEEKLGYINKKGEIVIEPQFDFAGTFNSEGLAPVRIEGKWGYINKEGEIVIEPQFDDAAGNFNGEGLAPVSIEGKWGYINKEGEIVIEPQFDDAMPFNSEGLAPVSIEGKWGYVNKEGEIVIEPQFDDARTFNSEGLAIVRIEEKTGVINTQGEIVIDINYDYIQHIMIYETTYFEGRKYDSHKEVDVYTRFNKEGDVIIEAEYIGHGYNLLEVIIDGKMEFINNEGHTVIEEKFDVDDCGVIDTLNYQEDQFNFFKDGAKYDFRYGIRRVNKNGKVGYINDQAEVIIEPQYDSAARFSDYLVIGIKDNTIEYIDIKNNIKITPKLDDNTNMIPNL